MGGWREAFVQGVHSPRLHGVHSGWYRFTDKLRDTTDPGFLKACSPLSFLEILCSNIFFLSSVGSTFAQFLCPLSEHRVCSPGGSRRAGQVSEGKAATVAPLGLTEMTLVTSLFPTPVTNHSDFLRIFRNLCLFPQAGVGQC
jgi:hypothetical protein